MTGKTGGGGGRWVILDRPKPAKVADYTRYWGDPPPEVSDRCRYWMRQIERGWRPNRFISRHCRDCSAEWYGVYLWEYLHLLQPLLDRVGPNDHLPAVSEVMGHWDMAVTSAGLHAQLQPTAGVPGRHREARGAS